MGTDETKGERGPQGDHGQHGDTGDTGSKGDTGLTGLTGLTGKQGARGLPISSVSQLIVYVLIVATFLFALHRSNDARRASEAVSKAGRLLTLTNCVRNNIDSALVIGSISFTPPGETAKQHAAKPLIARNLYPIYDCKQSQIKGFGIPLSPAETKKYVKLVTIDGLAPIVNHGKVIGSRPSILAQVKSFEDAGKKK